jgi:SAM-dependent methyltransferase
MVTEKPVFGGQVAAHYEAWYETPDGSRADKLEKAALRRLLGSFPQARSVLEVGCGTGHFTRWLGEQRLAAVGLDLSADMLAKAQTLNGLSFVRGDTHHLPFADGAFDVVAFVTTLEFLSEPQQALMEALRVARRGLLLGVLNRWSLLGLKRRLAERARPSVYRAARFYGVGELKRLLKSVGGDEAHVVWHTTLFPRQWPRPQSALPCGGFIAMALLMAETEQRDEEGCSDKKKVPRLSVPKKAWSGADEETKPGEREKGR